MWLYASAQKINFLRRGCSHLGLLFTRAAIVKAHVCNMSSELSGSGYWCSEWRHVVCLHWREWTAGQACNSDADAWLWRHRRLRNRLLTAFQLCGGLFPLSLSLWQLWDLAACRLGGTDAERRKKQEREAERSIERCKTNGSVSKPSELSTV